MIDRELNSAIFFGVIALTFGFWWLLTHKMKSFTLKTILFLVYGFFCLYCGCGIAIEGCNPIYAVYYFLYLIVITIVLKKTIKENCVNKNDEVLSYILKKYGKFIIIMYTFLQLLTLVVPEFKLHLLLKPPMPDVASWLEETSTVNHSFIEAVIYYMSNLFMPFFYLSLYKFNDNKKIIALVLAANLYIFYCANGNIGRSSILVAVLILMIANLQDTSIKHRKRALLYSGGIMMVFLVLFYLYSLIRTGDDISGLEFSLSDMLFILFNQEIGYPMWFDYYVDNIDYSRTKDYFQWFFLLPLPGFLKFGAGNFQLNRIFTYEVLGITEADKGFSIILPGLLGESYFIFGPTFFLIAAAGYAFIVAKVFNFLSSNEKLTYLLLFYAVGLSFDISRGGTISVYPEIVKHLLIFIIVLYCIKTTKVNCKRSKKTYCKTH